jgi:hypothetical protein
MFQTMTTQKRTLVSPADVIGIEYECSHFQQAAQAISQAKSTEGSDDAAFIEFVAAFQRLEKLSAGVAIRFEILEIPNRE